MADRFTARLNTLLIPPDPTRRPCTRQRAASTAACVALVASLAPSLLAVQVDAPQGPVQNNAPCSADAAEACDLRIYQVMVESFVDGDSAHNYNAGYGTSHHRGDLRGIINSLDYVQNLGMNAIWMTPIFDSHAGEPQARLIGSGTDLRLDATGYYTRDYFSVDPKFGTLADARELVNEAHARGIYVLFDGVFGHHKGNLVPSPTGKLPLDSVDFSDYGGSPQHYPGRVVEYDAPQTTEFYQEVATYWINELGIDGWRLDQAYQVPPSAWQDIKSAVDAASAARAQSGETWGTLGYMVAEIFSGNANDITSTVYGTNANPVLDSAFDFPVRYATVGVLGAEESGLSGRPASTLGDSWSYGAHHLTYPDHVVPNLMLGNHDLVRLGDLLQRADIADPADAEYWARHELMFMVQAAYSGPITRYYGEEIGDELPGFDDRVGGNCAAAGVCDDHVARTSAKILGVTTTAEQLTSDQHALLDFHRELMDLRGEYRSLSHGSRQHLYSDNELYVDLKSLDGEEIVFAMNVSDQAIDLRLRDDLFASAPPNAWDLLGEAPVEFNGGYLEFTMPPLSGVYILLDEAPTLPGDFDGDGDRDGDDFLAWQQGNSPNPTSAADLADWAIAYGITASPPATNVIPEPTSIALLLIAASALPRPGRARFSGRGVSR